MRECSEPPAARRWRGFPSLAWLAAASAAGSSSRSRQASACCKLLPAAGRRTGRRPLRQRLRRLPAGDACTSSTTCLVARSRLGDRCCGELAACWSSMGRWQTALGGGTGGQTGGGRGDDGNGVADKDSSLLAFNVDIVTVKVLFLLQLTSLCADEILQANAVPCSESSLAFPLCEMHKKWCQFRNTFWISKIASY